MVDYRKLSYTDAKIQVDSAIRDGNGAQISTTYATISTVSGKAPTNHKSAATTYGVGDATNYGHVKLDTAIGQNTSRTDVAISESGIKTFVNNSINALAAYYITKNASGDPFATHAELAASTTVYSGGVVRVPTRNDYCIVLADETNGNGDSTRYTYNSDSATYSAANWAFQYVYNKQFTTAQMNALDSGITSGKVSNYDAHIDNTKIHVPTASAAGYLLTSANDAAPVWSPTCYVSSNKLYSNSQEVLTSHQTIKQDGVTGATVNRYGVCSTASGTAAKTVSITTGTFTLETGARVSVYFTANTATNPTLNVNSTGAKSIRIEGLSLDSAASAGYLKGVCDFVYDGTYWNLIKSWTTMVAKNVALDTGSGEYPLIGANTSVGDSKVIISPYNEDLEPQIYFKTSDSSLHAPKFYGKLNDLTFTKATTGFTIAGGTTSKTLTLDTDLTASNVLTSHQVVVNSNPTLSWGNTSQVGTVGGTALQVTMPANPNTDVSVTQTTDTSTSSAIPILIRGVSTSGTAGGVKYAGPTITPSTGTLTATKLETSQVLSFSNTSNPYITMATSNTTFYIQSSGGKIGIGPSSLSTSLTVDSTGKVNIPVGLELNNGVFIKMKNSSGTTYDIMRASSDNNIEINKDKLGSIRSYSGIFPDTTNAYDLGTSTYKWKDLYLSGSLTGNVTGNLTGNVTGNVTGNCSGSAGSVAWANISSNPFSSTQVSITEVD